MHRKITTSTIRDLPNTEWKTSDVDPFVVDPPVSWWISLPVFFLTLPATALSFLALFLYGSVVVLRYPSMSVSQKDVVAQRVSFLLLFCARLRLKVIDHSGGEHAQLFIGNHICMLEGAIMARIVGHIRFLAASFSRDIPIFGALIRAVEPIFVERHIRTNKVALQIKKSILESGMRHVIFPEGSYANSKALLEFKSGAFVPGVPITPVLFVYDQYTPYWNRKESSLLVQMYRFLSRWYTAATVEILPVYTPSLQERDDPKVYAENVRRYMSYYLGCCLSNRSVFDSPNYKIDVEDNPKD